MRSEKRREGRRVQGREREEDEMEGRFGWMKKIVKILERKDTLESHNQDSSHLIRLN